MDFHADIQRLTEDFTGREWFFSEIDEWLRSSESFFILTGEAGIGKSAIAAQLTKIRQDIAAHHFCIAGRNSTIVPSTVLRSIAAQLGAHLPDYGLALANTIEPTYLSVNSKIDVHTMTGGQITGVVISNLTLTDPKREIESLLTAPLKAMPVPPNPVVIMLDSLDEAFTYDPGENLATLMAGLTDLPHWVRFLFTTRPEKHVLSYFSSVATHVVPAESHLNRADLRRYVDYRVNKPTIRTRIQNAENPLTAETLVERIAGKEDDSGLADGNFLYTKILLNDIESGAQPLNDLAQLPSSLDEIYGRFLLRLQPQWESKYQPLLAVLAIAREPLTSGQLEKFGTQSASLVGGRMSATLVISALGTLVQFLDTTGEPGQERYSLFHKSLRDYLVNQVRSGIFACPPEDGHAAIANHYWPAAFSQTTGGNDWNACDNYGLAHLPVHLAEAGRDKDLHALRFDYGWLQAKLDRLGVQALLADFRLSALPADDVTLKLSRALEQGVYVLAQDPTQLATQLLGRLLCDDSREIQKLVTQASKQRRGPRLLPLTASLRQEDTLLYTLVGHTEGVTGVALTPDGSRAISYSSDNTLRVWDLARGQELRTLTGHTGEVTGVAVTPDSSRAISYSDDKTLKVWDLASGRELHTFVGHTDKISGVAVIANGNQALSSSWDKTLKVWDLASGKELHTLEGHTGWVTSLAVTPDGSRAISSSGDGTLKIWDLESGKELHTLIGHTDSVSNVSTTADGTRVISFSNKTIKVWDLATGKELRTLRGHWGRVTDVAVTPDSSRVISSSSDGTLMVWDLTNDRKSLILEGHTEGVTDVKMTPNDNHVITTSWDHTLKVWDLASGRELHTFVGHTEVVTNVAVTPDGGYAISSSDDSTLKVWDLAGGQILHTLAGYAEWGSGVAVTPDGSRVIYSSSEGNLTVWDLASGQELRTIRLNTGYISGVVVTPDGNHVISFSSGYGYLKLWDLTSGQELQTFAGHSEGVWSVTVTPDGSKAVSASSDKKLKVWDLASGQELHTLVGHTDQVMGVAVTPDGGRALSYSSDQTLKVWDLANGQVLHTLTGHIGNITDVAMAPDGNRVISCSWDKTLKVWDLLKGSCLVTFHADGSLQACAVTPDGSIVVTGGASGRVHFLRLEE